MGLKSLARDEVFIEKADGSKSGPHKASVSASAIIIFDASIDVDDGDHATRQLENGKTERYLINSADFHKGLGGIPASYQLKVTRTTAIPPSQPKAGHQITINNSTGVQIGDHNVQHIQEVLAELAEKISNSSATADQKAEARSRLSAFLAHPATVAVLGVSAQILAATIQSP